MRTLVLPFSSRFFPFFDAVFSRFSPLFFVVPFVPSWPPFPGPFGPPFHAPPALDFAAWGRPVLEAQRSYLLWYRDQLQKLTGDEEGDPQQWIADALSTLRTELGSDAVDWDRLGAQVKGP